MYVSQNLGLKINSDYIEASLKDAEGHQLWAEGHGESTGGVTSIAEGARVDPWIFIFLMQILYSGAFLAQKMSNC